jgi:hypothetical protein
MLVGTAPATNPISISEGLLCLEFSGGNQVGRFNIANTPLNSIGWFDPAGSFQNLVGTSSTGTGFDIPNWLPFGSIVPVQAGHVYYYQLWYRDMNSGVSVSNFSNGYPFYF